MTLTLTWTFHLLDLVYVGSGLYLGGTLMKLVF